MPKYINWKGLGGLFGAARGKTLEFNKIWPRARLTGPSSTNPFLGIQWQNISLEVITILIKDLKTTKRALFCPSVRIAEQVFHVHIFLRLAKGSLNATGKCFSEKEFQPKFPNSRSNYNQLQGNNFQPNNNKMNLNHPPFQNLILTK